MSQLKEIAEDLCIDLDIKSKEDDVKEADEEYKKLIKEGDGLESKLIRLKNDIEENITDLIKMSEVLAKKREALFAVNGRKKLVPDDKRNLVFWQISNL